MIKVIGLGKDIDLCYGNYIFFFLELLIRDFSLFLSKLGIYKFRVVGWLFFFKCIKEKSGSDL